MPQKNTKPNTAFGAVFITVISLLLVLNFLFNGVSLLISSFDPTPDSVVGSSMGKEKGIKKSFEENFFLNQLSADAIGKIRLTLGGDFIFRDGVNDIYRDTTGRLTYLCRYKEMKEEAAALESFSLALEKEGVPMVYGQIPFKILPEEDNLIYRLNDYSNANADRLLLQLTHSGVDCYDLRDVLIESDREISPLFFLNDSRWQIGTAFDAYKTMLAYCDKNYHLCSETAQRFGLDENFAITRTDNCFLGNQGSAVGVGLISKLDAFDTVTPYAKTSFSVEILRADGTTLQRQGDYNTALMVKQTANTALFESYLGAAAPRIHIKNQKLTTGERVLIVGDDFINPFAAFFSLNVQETLVINPSLYEGSLLEEVRSFRPDLVIVLYNPKSFEQEAFFDFA